jgi:hypothetical protein
MSKEKLRKKISDVKNLGFGENAQKFEFCKN